MARAIVLVGLAIGGTSFWLGEPAFAADQTKCLSPTERNAAITDKRAVPLGRAARATRGQGDMLRAKLCEDAPGLVYRLTILGRDGKVTEATVDASNGQLLGPIK
ncbi:hypothetical protein GJW-30_1_03770 [Variibacter gotjawalensis]|uniref:PepSY domain-containing protein n=1 Tax=Variibacter gotjawalensis TaxID=1333996 RepID=A0A0S3PZ58_9BRAD|nr:hypothetical protein [Variibacter gotjawalensis]NIK47050.1 putative membrane protein YkoI [Variibacter gotjawalensis]RZS48955.1 hypothetical protein EV661_1378 [Variibacter gotjawalensis]BAT61213.1 hypothetical protein GJW-30_1_03770 [Variibacter gotjawalensis]